MVDLSLTIVIQCINFGILLWLLKKVLFGPVMQLLDKRASDVRKLKEDAESDRRKARKRMTEAEDTVTNARKESLDMVAVHSIAETNRTTAFGVSLAAGRGDADPEAVR